jgi:tyrosyl-tRNA synthetase
VETAVFPSKGECRKMIKNGGLSINKEKMQDENQNLHADMLINNKFILVQKGKKNYYLIKLA